MKVFSFGQRVVHTGKPEWGAGVITTATKSMQDGKPCQMLTIRFDRAGIKTISTAFANLVPAEEMSSLASAALDMPGKPSEAPMSSKEADFAARLMGEPGQGDIRQRMTKLPENASDPFATPIERLKSTIALFRFQPTGGSLLDWAAMQSGLADPLSRFNRHELEKFFEGFVIARDQHLKKTIAEARKADPAASELLVKQAPASVQQALRRLDASR